MEDELAEKMEELKVLRRKNFNTVKTTYDKNIRKT